MNISRLIGTKLNKMNNTKLSVIMVSSKCTASYAECIGMLRINFVMKFQTGSFIFQLPIKISKRLGI